MCKLCLVLKDGGVGRGGRDMKKQCDDCSERHARHRLSFKDKSSGHELVAWSENERIYDPARAKTPETNLSHFLK